MEKRYVPYTSTMASASGLSTQSFVLINGAQSIKLQMYRVPARSARLQTDEIRRMAAVGVDFPKSVD